MYFSKVNKSGRYRNIIAKFRFFRDIYRLIEFLFSFPGWVLVPIKDHINDRPLRTFMIQIAVVSNHQNGRDTHMRQIKIHSPCEGRGLALDHFGTFSTVEFQQYSTIRWTGTLVSKRTNKKSLYLTMNDNSAYCSNLTYLKNHYSLWSILWTFSLLFSRNQDQFIRLLKKYYELKLCKFEFTIFCISQ